MPKNLKRYYGLGHPHFITFSCYRRMALLGIARSRNAFLQALDEVRAKYQFALVGYVVMPEQGAPTRQPARAMGNTERLTAPDSILRAAGKGLQ